MGFALILLVAALLKIRLSLIKMCWKNYQIIAYQNVFTIISENII